MGPWLFDLWACCFGVSFSYASSLIESTQPDAPPRPPFQAKSVANLAVRIKEGKVPVLKRYSNDLNRVIACMLQVNVRRHRSSWFAAFANNFFTAWAPPYDSTAFNCGENSILEILSWKQTAAATFGGKGSRMGSKGATFTSKRANSYAKGASY